MAKIKRQKFKNGDLVRKMHLGDVFKSCTFSGTAKDCNFAEAKFEKTCSFRPGFKFEHCNLILTDGIEDVPRINCTYMGEEERRQQLEVAQVMGDPKLTPDFASSAEEPDDASSKRPRFPFEDRHNRIERETPDRD